MAEAVLLACGFRPTDRFLILRDILMCDEVRVAEKLAKHGVAPETIEELRKADICKRPDLPVPPATPPVPPVTPPVPPVTPPVPPVTPPLPPQRPHVEAFNAQRWLRSELERRLAERGWQINEEVPVERSRIDIVLIRQDRRHLIEVKQIERGTVYWREEQIKTAQLCRNEYVVALVDSTEEGVHDVRWVWNPLADFEGLERRVSWYWKEHPAAGGLDENWEPLSPKPALQPDVYKAVIQLSPHFIESLERGIEAFVNRVGRGALNTKPT